MWSRCRLFWICGISTAVGTLLGVQIRVSHAELALPQLKTPALLRTPVLKRVKRAPKKGRHLARTLRPRWSDRQACYSDANDSFLSSRKTLHQFGSGFFSTPIDQRTTWDFQQQLARIDADYERRKAHGQLGLSDQLAHRDQVRDLGNRVVRRLQDNELNEHVWGEYWNESTRRRVEDTMRDIERGDAVYSTPVSVAATIAAVSLGRPVRVRIQDDSQLFARTDVRQQRSEIALSTPIVDTQFNYSGMVNPIPAPGQQAGERYSLSVGRTLPIWSLRSGVSYGGSSSLVSASLSKDLIDNLEARLQSSRPSDPGRQNARGEDSLQLNYNLRF